MLCSAFSLTPYTTITCEPAESSKQGAISTNLYGMEPEPHRRRAQPRQGQSYSREGEAFEVGLETYSSPLPQAEWLYAGPSYQSSNRREQDQVSPEEQYASSLSQDLHARLRPIDYSRRQRPAGRMRRRRRSHELFLNEDEVPSDHHTFDDVSLLYPQMGPYEDRWSTYSAPDELEHSYTRSGEPTIAPGYMLLSSPDDISLVQLPRDTTTYLPVTVSRRTHSNPSTRDTLFADVDDFHLFAQATAGLRPEEAFIDPPRESLVPAPLFTTSRTVQTVRVDSPDWEESGTMRAFQQLARIPESYQSSQREVPPLAIPDFDPRPSVIRAATVIPEISPVESEHSDEELPNYAESQAEAHARQRYEATRRAEELRRRWQQTGARRGL